jgi:hypothetical protein
MNMFEMEKKSFLTLLPLFANMMVGMCEQTLNHTNVQKLIHSDEKFDVVIVEQFLNEAQKALATRFNAPLILFSTMGANSWVNQFNWKSTTSRLHTGSLTRIFQQNDILPKIS